LKSEDQIKTSLFGEAGTIRETEGRSLRQLLAIARIIRVVRLKWK